MKTASLRGTEYHSAVAKKYDKELKYFQSQMQMQGELFDNENGILETNKILPPPSQKYDQQLEYFQSRIDET